MLRITQRSEGDTVVLVAEGRLAGAWVEELRRVLQPLVDARSAVALELVDVGYVDAAGELLLREAISSGAQVRRSSSFVAAVLTEVEQEPTPNKAPGNARGRDRDRELVDRVLAGEEHAFVELVEAHHVCMTRV